MPTGDAATVAQLCRGGARRAPERNAIESQARTVTFAELDRRTEALARAFQQLVDDDQRVGIYCSNRVEWVEAYVAAHKAGISAVPINHRYRSRELEHILRDARLGLVVHDDTASDDESVTALLSGIATLELGEPFERAATGSAEPVTPRHAAEDVIVYTSGTTALPKGVVYTKHTQITSVFVPQLMAGYDPSDRFLLFTPLAHRAAQPLLLCALFMGATTHLLTRYTPDGLVAAVHDHGVTTLVGVPTALKDLLVLLRSDELEPMTGVRHVLMTGETVGAGLLAEIMSLFPNARFSSAYGSTEAGLVTYLDHEHQLSHSRSCGRALPGVDVRLVGDDGGDVATGEPGEVLVRAGVPGTYTVAAGYLGADGVESFTDDDGWFRTGDIAVVEDGSYRILGRKSVDIIKSGGYKLSALEIEAVLGEHPDIAECTVVGVPDQEYGERVAVAVVLRTGAVLGLDRLRAWARERMASYKLPTRLREVTGLPRNAMGKVVKPEVAALFQ